MALLELVDHESFLIHGIVRRQNTYLINFGLYKSSKILTHDLHHANNVTFN